MWQNTGTRASDAILLSFTGIGHRMGGIEVQKPEFRGAGKTFGCIIFITDKTRSWGNAIDFNIIEERILPFIENRDVYSIGNSMGGFISIVATRYLPIRKSISFAPQYSVDPVCVDWEHRWKSYTEKINKYSVQNAGNYLNDRTTYFILSGGMGNDKKHAMLFPARANIFHYQFSETGHNVAAALKKKGMLDGVIHSCFNNSGRLDIDMDYEQLSP